MPAGGRRIGAGRKAGIPNKRTMEREAALQKAAAAVGAALPGAFEGDAHALLMAVYKDPRHDMALRIDAAKAAIRFEKPSLASIEAKVALTVEEMSDEQIDEAIRRDAAAAGLLARH